MVNGKSIFGQPVNNDLRTYENTQKIPTSQEVDYTNFFLLDYPYFKKCCNMIAIDLSKQLAV